jgi:hypothetical protein
MRIETGVQKMVLRFFLASLFFLPTAFAGESLFSRTYTTETVPAGHYELEQTVRNRYKRSFGSYSAWDFRSEFEYGFTDNFQGAVYLNTEQLNASGAPDDNDFQGSTGIDRNSFHLTSISLEFIYRVLSPVSDPIGLAFYWEPEWQFYDIHNGDQQFGSSANEFRVLIQKNFLDDTLILSYNMVLELEYFRYSSGATQSDTPYLGELDWNHELGISYRVTDNWYAGWEFRNHNEVGNFWSHDHSVYWTGPVVHYGSQRFWATLGTMREVYGVPSGNDDKGSYMGKNLFLHSHELWETTLKFALAF